MIKRLNSKAIEISLVVIMIIESLWLAACSPGVKEVTAQAAVGQVIDKDKKELKDERVVTSPEEFDSTNLPLIAAIPEKNIFLYGIKPNGVVLYVSGKGHYFPWDYLTPRFILPRLNLGDFDSDGHEEIAVILYVGSGTGISVEELHVIELAERELLSENPEDKNYLLPNPDYFKDNYYNYSEYTSQLEKATKIKTYRSQGELKARINLGDKTYDISLKSQQDLLTKDVRINNKPSYGHIVGFEVKDKRIIGKFNLGLTTDSYATPISIGNVIAEVVYDSGRFKLKNLYFEAETGL